MPDTFWFMRMKQGSHGEDFAAKLWCSNRCGVLYGNWKIEDVLTDDAVDPAKLTGTADVWHRKKSSVTLVKSFLKAPTGDRIAVVDRRFIHIAVLGDVIKTTSSADRITTEILKCRQISKSVSFAMDELPSVFRLVSQIGRTSFTPVRSLGPLLQRLVAAGTALRFKAELASMDMTEFLGLLPPESWESLCEEYLRCKVGFRSLLLRPGKTMAQVDLVGVDKSGNRVLAQCKNDSRRRGVREISVWRKSLVGLRHDDKLYYFARGGFAGDWAVPGVHGLVSGREIGEWLSQKDQSDYLRDIRTL